MSWSGCSVTCGGWGTKTRQRQCIGPLWGGRQVCTPGAVYTDVGSCYTSPCTSHLKFIAFHTSIITKITTIIY